MSQNVWLKRYQTINDYKFPLSFKPDNVKSAINYINNNLGNNDKIVVTYPKCGTTWTKQIIFLILNNGLPQKSSQEMDSKTLFIDTEDCNQLITDQNNNNMDSRTVIFSHLPLQLIPFNKMAKYLLILRNPKDASVSYYYHSINRKSFEFNGSFHQFFQYWVRGEVPYGDYFQFVLDYWKLYKQVNDKNRITVLFYEDMKRNTRDAVLSIGRFLGEQYVNKLLDNDQWLLNQVLRYSSVEFMKSELKIEVLVRKGESGEWKQHFTDEESERVDEKFKDVFSGTDLIDTWKEDMKW